MISILVYIALLLVAYAWAGLAGIVAVVLLLLLSHAAFD